MRNDEEKMKKDDEKMKKISAEKLLDCIGGVGDDLILESENAAIYNARGWRETPRSSRWLTLAAVFVLGFVVVGLYFFSPGLRLSHPNEARYNFLTGFDGAERAAVAETSEAVVPHALGTATPVPGTVQDAAPPPALWAAPQASPPPVPFSIPFGGQPRGFRAGEVNPQAGYDDEEQRGGEARAAAGAAEAPLPTAMPPTADAPMPGGEEPFEWDSWLWDSWLSPVQIIEITEEALQRDGRLSFDLAAMHGYSDTDSRRLLRTNKPLVDVKMVELEYDFLLRYHGYYFVIASMNITERWEPNVPLLLENYIEFAHPRFMLSFMDEAGEEYFITPDRQIFGYHLPVDTVRVYNHLIIPMEGLFPDDSPFRLLDTVHPAVIPHLLGDFAVGEIREIYADDNPRHILQYSVLEYDRRENFYLRVGRYPAGEILYHTLDMVSQAAEDVVYGLYGMGHWVQIQRLDLFNTQTGDAIFVFAPRINTSWLMIDIGEFPREISLTESPLRAYAAILNPR